MNYKVFAAAATLLVALAVTEAKATVPFDLPTPPPEPVAVTPEPGTMLLFALGAAGLGVAAYRRKLGKK